MCCVTTNNTEFTVVTAVKWHKSELQTLKRLVEGEVAEDFDNHVVLAGHLAVERLQEALGSSKVITVDHLNSEGFHARFESSEFMRI